MDANRQPVLTLFEEAYGTGQAVTWFNRWRVFYMACSELFGFKGGDEWFVSHYLLSPVDQSANRDDANLDVAHA